MTPLVPSKTAAIRPGRLFQQLNDLLLSGLELVEATSGWIGLQGSDGLSFPVRHGVFSDSWLPRQHAHGSAWGFNSNDEIAVLNDLRNVAPKRGEPLLRNLLLCPLIQNKQVRGHLALANKARDFTAEDAHVLRGLAHHIIRLLDRGHTPKQFSINLSAAWQRILDRSSEGILLFEQSGLLIYANTVWQGWTGFRAEQMVGRTPPFPFWLSELEMVRALSMASAAPAGALPFRRCDCSLFWCEVETAHEPWEDQMVTLAFLRQTSSPPVHKLLSLRSPSPDWLPLLLDLDHGIEGWESHWEERTGLSVQYVKDSRCELVLDWLFPQQPDRNRVADCLYQPHPRSCQLILEVAASGGSRLMLCTFLPLPAAATRAAPRRWLLIVGEVEQQAGATGIGGAILRELARIQRTGNVSDG